MRRLILVLVLGAFLAVFSGGSAGAKPSSTNDGTYRYSDGGMQITVGYTCPGTPGLWGTDPDAQYWASTAKGRWSMTMARHDQYKLDTTFYAAFGLHLSDTAMQVLGNDAWTVPCP